MRTWLKCSRSKLNRSLSTISATLFISWYQVIVFFVWQGLEKIHQNSSGLPKELEFRHPKVSTIVACSAHLLVIQALVSSIPFSMLAYQFDWPLFLVKCLWQEQGNDFYGYYICESIRHTTCECVNMKCVNNNMKCYYSTYFHNFILLPYDEQYEVRK